MRSKIYALFLLIMGIHIAAIVQSCCFPTSCCDDYEVILIETRSVEVYAYEYDPLAYSNTEVIDEIDRNYLRIKIFQTEHDSVVLALERPEPFRSLLSPALAREECESFFYELQDHIERVEVLSLDQTKDFDVGEDITDYFVADLGSIGLYNELETVYPRELHAINLVCKIQPLGNSLHLMVNTILSNNSEYSDTVKVRLR